MNLRAVLVALSIAPFAGGLPSPSPAATVPDSPATGNAPAGVESGTENVPIIGDPAWSEVEWAEVDTPAVRLVPTVAVGLPPVPVGSP